MKNGTIEQKLKTNIKESLYIGLFLVIFLSICVVIIGIPTYNHIMITEETRIDEIANYAESNGYEHQQLIFKLNSVGYRLVDNVRFPYTVGVINVSRGNKFYNIDTTEEFAKSLDETNESTVQIDCYYNQELDDYLFPYSDVINSWSID